MLRDFCGALGHSWGPEIGGKVRVLVTIGTDKSYLQGILAYFTARRVKGVLGNWESPPQGNDLHTSLLPSPLTCQGVCPSTSHPTVLRERDLTTEPESSEFVLGYMPPLLEGAPGAQDSVLVSKRQEVKPVNPQVSMLLGHLGEFPEI